MNSLTNSDPSSWLKSNPRAFTRTSTERAILNARIKARFNDCLPIDFIEIEPIHRDCFVATNSKGTFSSSSYSGAWRRALSNL